MLFPIEGLQIEAGTNRPNPFRLQPSAIHLPHPAPPNRSIVVRLAASCKPPTEDRASNRPQQQRNRIQQDDDLRRATGTRIVRVEQLRYQAGQHPCGDREHAPTASHNQRNQPQPLKI